jgi:hypothetical protein
MAAATGFAGTRMIGEKDLAVYLAKFDKKYWLTYKVLDVLQKVCNHRCVGCDTPLLDCLSVAASSQVEHDITGNVTWLHEPTTHSSADGILLTLTSTCLPLQVFYRSNPAREAFVEMCESEYVQRMTFDSYLYKTVVPGNPLDDAKLAFQTLGSLLRGNALRQGAKSVSFGSKPQVAESVAA